MALSTRADASRPSAPVVVLLVRTGLRALAAVRRERVWLAEPMGMARRRARRVQAGMTADTRTLYAALQRHAAHHMPCSARAPAERSGRRAERGAAARSVGRERLGRRREEQVPLRLLDRREVACAARSIAARGHAHSVRTACSMTPTRFAFRREPPALHAGPRGHGRRLPRPVSRVLLSVLHKDLRGLHRNWPIRRSCSSTSTFLFAMSQLT